MKVDNIEYVEDAYEEIMKASFLGKIRITKFEDLSLEKRKLLKKTIQKEYDESIRPEYRYFLENKFNVMINKR